MSTFINSPNVVELRKDYEAKADKCRKYATVNMVESLESADSYYLKLLIERSEAELAYREENREFVHLPRIRVQLQHYRELLASKNGVIV